MSSTREERRTERLVRTGRNFGGILATRSFNLLVVMVFVLTVLSAIGAIVIVVLTDSGDEEARELSSVFSHAFTLGIGSLVGLIGTKAADSKPIG